MRLFDRLSLGRFPTLRGVPHNERITGMSDAVFAIVITLLVLELRVPNVPPGELGHALREMMPEILSHVGSFVVLGIYWVGHHNMFFQIKRHDRVLLWLNILFLLLVASMPFPTGLIMTYTTSQLPVIVLAGVLIAAGLVLDSIWWYATKNHRLVDEDISTELIKLVHRRVLMAPVVYLVAIGLSFVSLIAAKSLFILVALFYIVPSPLDRLLDARLNTREEEGHAPEPSLSDN